METFFDFLLRANYLYIKPISVVCTNIFYIWEQSFVHETMNLQSNADKLLLIMDVYTYYISYKTLKLLQYNAIIATGLPAHTSHVLQPLCISTFGPLKEYFRRLFSLRTVSTTNDGRNDIVDICELLRKSINLHGTVKCDYMFP